MLSRLHDERVFTSSDDVVFSASSSQAVQRYRVDKASPKRTASSASKKSARLAIAPRGLMDDMEEYKSGSDVCSDDQDAPADDELDEEGDEDIDEGRRIAGLKFPMQSPRHIAASQSYLHRQRRRGHANDTPATSPTPRRRVPKNPVHGVAELTAEREHEVKSAVAVSKEFMKHKISAQYHDRPMELVYMSTGEIRPRDECPPGLRLPLSSVGAPDDRKSVPLKLNASDSSSTVPITRQNGGASSGNWTRERPNSIQTKQVNPEGFKQKVTASRHRVASEVGGGSSDDGVGVQESGRRQTSMKKVVQNTKHTGFMGLDSEDAMAFSQERQQSGKQDGLRDLNVELQKEKKRVLEKTTQILEQQGKIQALQHQLQILQDRVSVMEDELESYAHKEAVSTTRGDSHIRELDHQVKALSDSVQAKDGQIRSLENQINQLKINRGEGSDRTSVKEENKIARLRQREAALAKQLEDLMSHVMEFHSLVECWKVNSREALEGCEKRSEMLELMEEVWNDFPMLVSERDSKLRPTLPSNESSTISFLTKKLRHKEEELRLTHVKYVELKELCARQCIREADLQNFINEHRLRGNLVIRKTDKKSTTEPTPIGGDRENDRRRANSVNEVAEGSPDSDEDRDSDAVVSKPKVFIDIKRSHRENGVEQEPSPIEHVRLAPSPALAQRYREQQLQQRDKPPPARGAATKHTTRAATVSSASRTLATTRHALTTASSRAATHKKTPQSRATTNSHGAGIPSRAASSRTSVAARRPSAVPLPSRPWV